MYLELALLHEKMWRLLEAKEWVGWHKWTYGPELCGACFNCVHSVLIVSEPIFLLNDFMWARKLADHHKHGKLDFRKAFDVVNCCKLSSKFLSRESCWGDKRQLFWLLVLAKHNQIVKQPIVYSWIFASPKWWPEIFVTWKYTLIWSSTHVLASHSEIGHEYQLPGVWSFMQIRISCLKYKGAAKLDFH